jgi:hypothetical protein
MPTLNRIKFIAIFLMIFSVSVVQAQFNIDKHENIQLIKKVPLLVVLDSPNKKILRKLTRKGPQEAEKYIAAIAGKNEVIKTTINRKWKISKDIKFVTSEEFKNYKTKENKGKYAYITSKVYDKVKSKKSSTGYLAYCNYSIFIMGDVSPVHEIRYSSVYGNTIVDNADVETVWGQMQSNFREKETRVARRMSKKELRKDEGYAKTKFSDDE